MRGAVLEFAMGPEPSGWGTAPDAAPPSVTSRSEIPAPRTDVTRNGIAHAGPGVYGAALFDDNAMTETIFGYGGAHWVQQQLASP